MDAVEWVHFGGISLAREPLAGKLLALARELKARGKKISYDPNFRALMDARYDTTLEHMTRLADVVKVSDEDLRGLFRCNDADAAFALLRAMNPQARFLYTRGEQGASLYWNDEAWHADAFKVKVADTVGAGDASIGALLYSLMTRPGQDGAAHLRFSIAAGAAACECAGARPPSLAQVQALLETRA
jgi:fructokinase